MAADPRPDAAVALDLIRAMCADLGLEFGAVSWVDLKRMTDRIFGALRSARCSGFEEGRAGVNAAIMEGSRN